MKFNFFVNWLKRPFPFYENYKQKLLEPILFSSFIMFFLIIFNPSNNSDFIFIQFWKILTYSSITFLVITIFNFILPITFQNLLNPEKWTIYKTIIFILLKFITVGLLNGIFAFQFDNPNNNLHLLSFLLAVFFRTVSIGFLPTIIFVFYLEKSLYKKHHSIALKTIEKLKNNRKNTSQKSAEKNEILSINSSEKIEIPINNLLCIKSDGNYCIFYFYKADKIEKKMIRLSLKDFEQKNLKFHNLLRCHKSYLINLDRVNNISGNARGYFFTINELNFIIPGSRNLSKSFINDLKNKI